MTRTWGYSVEQYFSLHTSYSNQPTVYQKASYGQPLLEIVSSDDVDMVWQLLSIGLSPNPYDDVSTGMYLVHMECVKYQHKLLNVMIEYGGSDVIQVVDNYGCTPLHAVCISGTSSSTTSMSCSTIALEA
jgi:hypothetical protein